MRCLFYLMACAPLLLGACSKEKKPRARDVRLDDAAPETQADSTGEFDLAEFERQARRHLSRLSYEHSEKWGMGKSTSWKIDLEAGVISWAFSDKVVSAPIQVVGTYVPAQQSMLWAWDHPSIKNELAQDCLKLKEWGDKHELTELTLREIKCSEAQAWTYTAMACKIAGAKGAFRVPSGQAFIFLTFGDISVRRPDITPHFDLER
ncbi:MAG: DUF6882 domain-containing protein [Luteolibacter sp.]